MSADRQHLLDADSVHVCSALDLWSCLWSLHKVWVLFTGVEPQAAAESLFSVKPESSFPAGLEHIPVFLPVSFREQLCDTMLVFSQQWWL